MSQVLTYQSEDGRTKLNVHLEDQTVWITQKRLTELFGKAKGTISEHIKQIFDVGELSYKATVRLFRTVQQESGPELTRDLERYNLDMVLALGFCVCSPVAVRFRLWAADPALGKEHAEREFVEFRRAEDQRLESDFDRAVKRQPRKDEP